MSKLPIKTQAPKASGLLQEIPVPTWKWEDINMDVVVGLPLAQRKNDNIWVVVDRFTKSAHFIPIKSTYSVEYYARILYSGIHHIGKGYRIHVKVLEVIQKRFGYKS